MRRAAALAALALGALPTGAAARGCPAVPAPPPASRPASAARIDAYVRAVASASPVVTTGVAGASTQGRPLRYAVVTRLAPARVRAGLARLRAVRAGHARSTAGAPAVVWLTASVHGNEPSGADADLRVLAGLAARCHDAALAHAIVVVLPVQNPDGRAAHTRVSGAGFDLNRDWLADTQPETRARYALLARYPPLVYADQHEQGGGAFFAPPYARPINGEIASAPIDAQDTVIGPAIARALGRAGIAHTTGGFDLLYPGYGDSATSLLYGAAGMTLEAGNAVPFARRVVAHETAARALLRAVAAHRTALLRRWPRAFAPRALPATSGWALAPEAADTVTALQAQGVRVRRLAAPASVALRPWRGGAATTTDLPAGTWVVPAHQPLGRWAAAALDQGAGTGAAPSDDVRAWSVGLLAPGSGGVIAGALPAAAPAATPAPGPRPLAGRRVALLADPGARSTVAAGRPQPSAGTAWARWGLEHQLGAGVDVVDGPAIATGALAGRDLLVVADGSAAALDQAALSAIGAWVRAGGTLAGWRARGVAVARSAGLVEASLAEPASGARADGTALDVLAPGGRAAALAAPDPVLSGGTPVADYADGTPAAAAEAVGAGRVLLLGFDPFFRAGTPGAALLLSGLLSASAGAR